MAKLSKEQTDQEADMIKLKNALAKADQDMINKKQDLKEANKDEKATKEYLASIKPQCDFILKHFEKRTKNRKLEKKALGDARGLLKKSPAYLEATAVAEA